MKLIFLVLFFVIIFLTVSNFIIYWNNIENFLNSVKSEIYQSSLFWAVISQILPQPENKTEEREVEPVLETEKIAEDQTLPPSEEKIGQPQPVFSLAEIQEQLDDISEKVDVLNQEVFKLIKKINIQEEIKDEEKDKIEQKEEETKEEKIEEEEPEEEIIEMGQEIGQTLCYKDSAILPLQNSVIINEIAWMGSINSSSDEWIELKNISGTSINLNGWQLLDKDNQIKIIFKKENQIPVNELFLLERTNDDSVPGMTADFIYTGALNDTNEAFYLFDNNCQLQDKILANPNWPAGDNSSKRTMERRADLSWQTSANPSGTPKTKNSSGYFAFSAAGAAAPAAEALPLPAIYLKILISEVKISEKRGDKDVFVEIYNPNQDEIDLSGWYLQRKTETSLAFSSFVSKNLFAGKKIPAKGYFLLVRQGATFEHLADIIFEETLTENNALILKNPNQEIVDQVSWQEIIPGKSLARIYDEQNQNYIESFEIQALTPKEKNNRLPIAIFSFFPQTPSEKEEILFDSSSSTDPDGKLSVFLWDFGDNNLATTDLATTTHIYYSFGQFLVFLLVTDERGDTSLATSSIEVAKMPQPVLEISTSTFYFMAELEENIASQTLTIENKGNKELDWKITTSHHWLVLNPASGTVPIFSSSSIEVLVNTFGLVSGNYTATATIECQQCQNNLEEIFVNLTLFPKTVKTVIINEIAWMGTSASNSSDEWLELYNNTDSVVDLSGWTLVATDGIPKITFTTLTIPAQSYLLLERTDDSTISDIPANLIYTGALGNNGEKLELRDNTGNLIDLVDCYSGWFAGTATLDYLSMERINPHLPGSYLNNWANNNEIIRNGLDANGNLIFGTPKSKNSVSP